MFRRLIIANLITVGHEKGAQTHCMVIFPYNTVINTLKIRN